MASLHAATGSPAAVDPRAFSVQPALARAAAHSHNPFLRSEAPPVALRPATQDAPAAEAVEVTVLWGSSVLTALQLAPPRPFAVGEVGGSQGAGTSPAGRVDFALASERLGSERRELVTLRNGAPFAVFAADETPRVLDAGAPVDAAGIIVDCSDVALGARGIELRQGRVVVLEASGVSFRLAGCEKPVAVPRAVLGSSDRSALTTLGSAALLQGLFVAALAYLTPSMAEASMAELDSDRLSLMQQYLHANSERNREEEEKKLEEGGSEQGAPAEAARGESGKAGRNDAPATPRRMAFKGESAERVVSRTQLRGEAENFGMVGMLNALNASSAPSAPWGADLATGPDALSAHGDMFSPDIGDAFGSGLALSGIGEGAGGNGLGIGMGGIGTCGGVTCLLNGKGGFGGNGDGFAGSRGRLTGTHQTTGPRIASAPPVLSGRLPSDVIQRIVRQNFGRFRQCYELGLRNNPNLEGRVVARFVIGRDGAVSNVSAGGDLPDAKVSSCVASAFYGLSFPAPDNGIVTVSYPIMLTPG